MPIYNNEKHKKGKNMATLKKLKNFKGVEGPLLTIVMDGVGIAPDNGANAVAAAHTPTLDRIMRDYPTIAIKAHGTAVGLQVGS